MKDIEKIIADLQSMGRRRQREQNNRTCCGSEEGKEADHE